MLSMSNEKKQATLSESDYSDESQNTENDNNKVRKSSKKIELVFGEQLEDDYINMFCDKLQAVCPKKIDGFLAIQFIMCEPENVKTHISGKNEALQVLYDRGRAHYLLTHYNPTHGRVEIFDSLQSWHDDETPTLPNEICVNIRTLYGHLYTDSIGLLFDKRYERQHDDFSCGYRCIGAIVDLARGENPAGKLYSRHYIHSFIQRILNDPRPCWSTFVDAKLTFGEKPTTSAVGGAIRMELVLHSTPSTTSSSSASTSSIVVSSDGASTAKSLSSVDENNNEDERNDAGREAEIDGSEDVEEKPTPIEDGYLWPRREMFALNSLKRVFNTVCLARKPESPNEEIIRIAD
ncbi:unnamed protein product [Caenorhabditis bovis]|uniref:Ubiquitin-like protease family profile domain-containing protein n=1 Tax=Caenorhabditis bovis TaxID=2654633 RepID=A0A8S1F1D0_9PELO|nr:unnamed protein product [Caenorhabditis bovis]